MLLPDPAPRYHCQKTAKNISLAEPRCANPTGYCKWRTACPVRLLEKEQAGKPAMLASPAPG